MSVEFQRRLLHNTPVFGGVADAILDLILERGSVVSVAQNEFFFQEGDRERSAFVLESGRVSVLKHWQNKSYLLRRLHAGACFGEMTWIDLRPREASARADEDCRALCFTADTLQEIYRRDLEQFTLIYMNMARELSRRLREADKRLFEAKVNASISLSGYMFESS